jgi:hypothetical protein
MKLGQAWAGSQQKLRTHSYHFIILHQHPLSRSFHRLGRLLCAFEITFWLGLHITLPPRPFPAPLLRRTIPAFAATFWDVALIMSTHDSGILYVTHGHQRLILNLFSGPN